MVLPGLEDLKVCRGVISLLRPPPLVGSQSQCVEHGHTVRTQLVEDKHTSLDIAHHIRPFLFSLVLGIGYKDTLSTISVLKEFFSSPLADQLNGYGLDSVGC